MMSLRSLPSPFPSTAVARRRRTSVVACLMVLLSAFALTPARAADEPPAGMLPDYRIAPEDVLEITVWREDDMRRQVTVRPDGGFSYPLIGDVKAIGLTAQELEETIRARLANYIPDAVVTVSVNQVRGLRVYVTGRVRSPGQFEVGRYVDVLQAITLAGGFTPFADTKNVQVIRRRDGGEQVFRFNYNDVERGRNLSQNIRLEADDVVLVP